MLAQVMRAGGVYTRTKYGGGIFWRPSVNHVAAVVMVPWTHNKNSWPEILRSTNRLSTAVHPSTIVLRYRHVCGTTHDCSLLRLSVRRTCDISDPPQRAALQSAENNLFDVGGAAMVTGYARKGFHSLSLQNLSPLSPFDHRQLTVVPKS